MFYTYGLPDIHRTRRGYAAKWAAAVMQAELPTSVATAPSQIGAIALGSPRARWAVLTLATRSSPMHAPQRVWSHSSVAIPITELDPFWEARNPCVNHLISECRRPLIGHAILSPSGVAVRGERPMC
jgi:hypothetical protein